MTERPCGPVNSPKVAVDVLAHFKSSTTCNNRRQQLLEITAWCGPMHDVSVLGVGHGLPFVALAAAGKPPYIHITCVSGDLPLSNSFFRKYKAIVRG